jgi:uncharacterized protein YjbJ (UPF0337 family)
MGSDDKADNKLQDLRGQVKETIGEATDDEAPAQQGRRDQAGADLKQAGEKVKDAFKH